MVSDITYLGIRTNPACLALVTDAYSKVVLGHDISNPSNIYCTVSAINKAFKNTRYKGEPLIATYIEGCNVFSNEYQKLLDLNNIKSSMTEKYDPYENVVAERMNGILR